MMCKIDSDWGLIVDESGVVAVVVVAGCPGGQCRKNALAIGEAGVLIHQVNSN